MPLTYIICFGAALVWAVVATILFLVTLHSLFAATDEIRLHKTRYRGQLDLMEWDKGNIKRKLEAAKVEMIKALDNLAKELTK